MSSWWELAAMPRRVRRRAVSLRAGEPAAWAAKLGHLLDAGGVEVTALAVLPAQESGVLVAASACVHGELFLRPIIFVNVSEFHPCGC